jgi:uncharacterized DUF497 family protein
MPSIPRCLSVLLTTISVLYSPIKTVYSCEQVFLNRPLLVLDDPKHSVSEKRLAAFGKTDGERFFVVIFTKRNDLIRIISARDMNKRERKFYHEKG